MAIIYSYPKKASPKTTDLLVISDLESVDPRFQTKNITIQSLLDLFPITYAQNAWSTLHVTNGVVPQADIVAVGINQDWTVAPADSSIELTSDPATSTLFIRAIGDGFDNMANADLVFNADHTADLQDATGAPNYTWNLIAGSDSVSWFSKDLITVGAPTGVITPTSTYEGGWFIPINDSLKGRDNVYLGGGADVDGIPANENWTPAINSDHEYINKSTALGIGALAFSGSINYFGLVSAATIAVQGAGFVDGPYTDVATTGGTGTGLTVDFNVLGGAVQPPVTINQPGAGYTNGEIVSIPGGTIDAQITITASTDENNIENTAVGHTSQYNFGTAVSSPGTDQFGQNTSLGYRSLFNNTGGSGVDTGSFNIAIGGRALESLNFGDRNTAVGHNVALDITTGYSNVIIGMEAGVGQASGAISLQTGANNVLIGHHADAANFDDNIIIGESSYIVPTVGGAFDGGSINVGVNSGVQGTNSINIGNNFNPLSSGTGAGQLQEGEYIIVGNDCVMDVGLAGVGETSTFSTHVGNSSSIFGWSCDTLGHGITLGIPGAGNDIQDNVIIGNNTNWANAIHPAKYNVGIGVLGSMNPAPGEFGQGSVGLGYAYDLEYDGQFLVNLFGSPDIDLQGVAGGAGVARDSNINLIGSLNISGNGNLVTPTSVTLDYEKTVFDGQTELRREPVVAGPITQLNFNNGDMVTIDLNNQPAVTLAWPENLSNGTYIIKFIQGAVTPTTLTLQNGLPIGPITQEWKWTSPGAPAPILTAATGAVDILTIVAVKTYDFAAGTETNAFNCYSSILKDFV